MALEFACSFGGYATAQLLLDWTFQQTAAGFGSNVVSAPAGRHGGNAVEFPESGGSSGRIFITLTHQATRIAGGAFYTNTTTMGSQTLIGFNNVTAPVIAVTPRGDNVLQIFINSVFIADTGAFVIHPNAWYYIELMATCSNDGTGHMQVAYSLRVDGAVLLTGTVVTTQLISGYQIPAAVINVVQYGGGGTDGLSNWYAQDIYILNGVDSGITGLPNNTFMGDIIIDPIVMQADSTPLQWTPSTGTAQWSLINEVPPDGDSTYIFDNTTGNVSSFVPQSIPGFVGTVQGVFARAYARKDDEGSKSFEIGVKPTTVSHYGPDQWVNDTYVYYKQAWDGNPDSNIQWTQTSFNNSIFQVKVTN